MTFLLNDSCVYIDNRLEGDDFTMNYITSGRLESGGEEFVFFYDEVL